MQIIKLDTMLPRLKRKGLVLVLTAEANLEKAQYLANKLLLDRLVSCISFQKINSQYFWDGKLEQNDEIQLLIKTNNSQLKKVLDLIEKTHSYDLPEILFWNASSSESYSEWTKNITNS